MDVVLVVGHREDAMASSSKEERLGVRLVTPTPALAVRRVRKAIEEMHPTLLERFREARALLETSVGSTAQTRYRIGQIVIDVMRDVDKYGGRSVALLATALGRNEDTLYDWARIADTWAAPAFAALLARRTAHGVPLSVSHLVVLASVRERAARDQATEEALTEGLSVKRLRAAIAGPLGSARAALELDDDDAVGGRRILTRIGRCAGLAVRRTSRLVSSLESIPEDELQDPAFVALLSRGVDQTRELVREFDSVVQRLEARLSRLTVPRAETRRQRKSVFG